MISVAALLLGMAMVQPVAFQSDDVVEACNPADADQHRMCKMRDAGSLLNIPAEMRFVTFDLMSGNRVSVTYAFPVSAKPRVEAAIRRHMAGTEERLNPWGHAEGTHVWRNAQRQYLMEIYNGKLSVTIEQGR